MIQNELKNEAEIRRFLLGGMTDDERSAIEEKFVADEHFFDQIRVVEDEVIESYVRGTLPTVEKETFEKSFLTTERRRQRVAFTRAMLDRLTESPKIAAVKKTETNAASPSVWNSITNFFKTPSLAFGAALAILLAVFGGWFLFRSSNTREIAQQVTPTPTPLTEILQSNSNPVVQSNQNGAINLTVKPPETIETNTNAAEQQKETPGKNSNIQKQVIKKDEKPAVNPVLALFVGTVRSEGKTKEINLPKNSNNVLLQLNLESQDYKIYRAEIVTADGEVVSKHERLRAVKSKINFSVPAGKLPRGDYLVKLSALNPQNEIESVADYTFRVNRK